MTYSNICLIEFPQGENNENEREAIFKEIMVETIP